MSKNVTIAEGSQARNFDGIKKLRTNLVGGGTQYWVPEDESGKYIDTKVLTVENNGTYSAQDYECDAFSKVSANVKPNTMDKQININGSYNASDDNVQAYSSVEVNVVKGDDTEIGDYYYPITTIQENEPLTTMGNIEGRGNIAFNDRYWCFDSNGNLFGWDEENNRWNQYMVWDSEGHHYSYGMHFPEGKSARGAALFPYDGPDGFDTTAVSVSNSSYLLYNQIWNFRRYATGDNAIDWFDDSSWPGIADGKGACKLGNTIHIFGGIDHSGGAVIHATYEQGTRYPTIDYEDAPPESNLTIGVYKDQIYGLSNNGNFYRYNGRSDWEMLQHFPVVINNMAIFFVEHKKKLHAFGQRYHYSFNGRWWRKEENVGSGVDNVVAAWVSTVDENKIHIIRGNRTHYVATYTE